MPETSLKPKQKKKREMPIEQLIQEIVKRYNRKDVLLVSLCGWADTGKTTLAQNICSKLNELNIASDCISTDSFMWERKERNRRGISGYHIESLKANELTACISRLKAKEAVAYFPYDNKLGSNATESRTITASGVIVIEGIHSFNEAIRSQVDLLIYIDAPVTVLEKLRFDANIKKRGFTQAEAGLRIKSEMVAYNRFVLPGKRYAHIKLTVDTTYHYELA